MDLDQLRLKVDQIDTEIIALLNQRAKLALQIGEQKTKSNVTVRDKNREKQVMQHITADNNGPLTNQQLQTIFKQIIVICTNIQQKNRRK